MKRGDIVQFKCDWEKEPTPGNTSIVKRAAKDGSWVDVVTPYGRKRVPNPKEHLRVITQPMIITCLRG